MCVYIELRKVLNVIVLIVSNIKQKNLAIVQSQDLQLIARILNKSFSF